MKPLKQIHDEEQREAREREAFEIFKTRMAEIEAEHRAATERIKRDSRIWQLVFLASYVFLLGSIACWLLKLLFL